MMHLKPFYHLNHFEYLTIIIFISSNIFHKIFFSYLCMEEILIPKMERAAEIISISWTLLEVT